MGRYSFFGAHKSTHPETYYSESFRYDPENDAWIAISPLPSLSKQAFAFEMIAYQSRHSNAPFLRYQVYDPNDGSLTDLSQPSVIHGQSMLVPIQNGSFLLVAHDQRTPPSNKILLWDASNDSWSSAGLTMPLSTYLTRALPLQNGKVLFFDSNHNSFEFNPSSMTFSAPVKKNHASAFSIFSVGSTSLYEQQHHAILPDGSVLLPKWIGHVNAATFDRYANGQWTPYSLTKSPSLLDGMRLIGVSSDSRRVTISDNYLLSLEIVDLHSGARNIVKNSTLDEQGNRAVQINDDEILIFNQSAYTEMNAPEVSTRVSILDMNSQNLAPAAHRSIEATDVSVFAFAKRYALLHSGKDKAGAWQPFELYDRSANAWKTIGFPPNISNSPTIAFDEDENALYFFSGQKAGNLWNENHVDRYDLSGETWSSIPIPQVRRPFGMAKKISAGKFLLVGSQYQSDGRYDIVDIAAETSIQGTAVPTARERPNRRFLSLRPAQTRGFRPDFQRVELPRPGGESIRP